MEEAKTLVAGLRTFETHLQNVQAAAIDSSVQLSAPLASNNLSGRLIVTAEFTSSCSTRLDIFWKM
jgi:hypothetical protein